MPEARQAILDKIAAMLAILEAADPQTDYQTLLFQVSAFKSDDIPTLYFAHAILAYGVANILEAEQLWDIKG
jgi:uncharacterized membrane protein (DUF2068 family)